MRDDLDLYKGWRVYIGLTNLLFPGCVLGTCPKCEVVCNSVLIGFDCRANQRIVVTSLLDL